MMFFFIGGVQPKTVNLEKQSRVCPVCSHTSLNLKRVDHYLSLFFIPLFPVKKGIPFQICDNCRSIFDEQGYKIDIEKKEWGGRCPHCGRPVIQDFNYCPYCGKAVR
jgi:RNA polymerase subunit RPABC4/transcription elongation factor Spt4